jgi:hypothetical protein
MAVGSCPATLPSPELFHCCVAQNIFSTVLWLCLGQLKCVCRCSKKSLRGSNRLQCFFLFVLALGLVFPPHPLPTLLSRGTTPKASPVHALQAAGNVRVVDVPNSSVSGARQILHDLRVLGASGNAAAGDTGSAATAPQEIGCGSTAKPSSNVQFVYNCLLALDVSTSMDGERLEVAKASALELVTALVPDDSVGVMAFESEVFSKLPLTRLGTGVNVAEVRLMPVSVFSRNILPRNCHSGCPSHDVATAKVP